MENSKTNSAISANQPGNTGTKGEMTHQPAQLPTRVSRPGHRLLMADAILVAQLCALRANEKEACALLSISYNSWNSWKRKAKNDERFQSALDRIRASKIFAHLGNIESFAAKDFRASVAYIEKTMPEKYSTRAEAAPQAAPGVNTLSDESMMRLLALLRASQPQAQVIDVPASEPKQLENAKPENA